MPRHDDDDDDDDAPSRSKKRGSGNSRPRRSEDDDDEDDRRPRSRHEDDDDDEEDEEDDDRPRQGSKKAVKSSKPTRSRKDDEDDDEEDDDDDRPRKVDKKKAVKSSKQGDDDEDDEEDEEDEEDDDDRPRKRTKKKAEKSGNPNLIYILVGGVLLLLAGGAYLLFFSGDGNDNTNNNKSANSTDKPKNDPNKGSDADQATARALLDSMLSFLPERARTFTGQNIEALNKIAWYKKRFEGKNSIFQQETLCKAAKITPDELVYSVVAKMGLDTIIVYRFKEKPKQDRILKVLRNPTDMTAGGQTYQSGTVLEQLDIVGENETPVCVYFPKRDDKLMVVTYQPEVMASALEGGELHKLRIPKIISARVADLSSKGNLWVIAGSLPGMKLFAAGSRISDSDIMLGIQFLCDSTTIATNIEQGLNTQPTKVLDSVDKMTSLSPDEKKRIKEEMAKSIAVSRHNDLVFVELTLNVQPLLTNEKFMMEEEFPGEPFNRGK